MLATCTILGVTVNRQKPQLGTNKQNTLPKTVFRLTESDHGFVNYTEAPYLNK